MSRKNRVTCKEEEIMNTSNLARKMIRKKCLKVNRRKVLSSACDVERLVMNRGDDSDLSHGRALSGGR